MKIFHILFLLISLPCFGQNNFLGQAKFSIPTTDFIGQFSNDSTLSRIYCFNKKGEKVWLTNIQNFILTLVLKDGKPKKIKLGSAKYKNGLITGVDLKRSDFKIRMATFDFTNISSIVVQAYYSIESPYFDFDSSKKVWQVKADSLDKLYSSEKELVLYLMPKDNTKKDTLLIYANACYAINFSNNVHIKNGVVQKITTDSIYISNNFDSNTAKANKEDYKVLKYSFGDIKEISILKGNGFSYKNINITDFIIVPIELEKDKLVQPCWFEINSYSGKVEFYRLLLTANGFLGIKAENGKIYWYEQ
jgi:hypothetical protein